MASDAKAALERTLTLAATAGRMILESGAEIYRVEETVLYLCRSMGFPDAETVCVPTSVTITIRHEGAYHTASVRIKKRTVNLSKLSAVNAVSRSAALGHITGEDALVQLEALAGDTPRPLAQILAAAFSGVGFALMLGANAWEALSALLAGGLAQLLKCFFVKREMNNFNAAILSSAGLALAAQAAALFLPDVNHSLVITAALICFLPGLAFTNAVRDIINGDLNSGVIRGAEAIIGAVGLAVGVGVVLAVWRAAEGGLFNA